MGGAGRFLAQEPRTSAPGPMRRIGSASFCRRKEARGAGCHQLYSNLEMTRLTSHYCQSSYMYGNREERAAADVQDLRRREAAGRKNVRNQLAPQRQLVE